MKDLGRTKFCLELRIEQLKNGIFVHQEAYTAKVLKQSYMDKSHMLTTLMVVRALDVNKDHCRPREGDEELLDLETPYLSAIRALMYLVGYTIHDMSFVVKLLASY